MDEDQTIEEEADKADLVKDFYNLTPNKILNCVEEIGVRCSGRLLQLNSMENRVYEAEIELPGSPDQYSRYDRFKVIKFYRPGRWSPEQIGEEHQFLFDLEQSEIPAVTPVKYPSDNATAHFDAQTKSLYTVFPKVSGRNLDELSPDQLEQIGRLVARIHTVGASSKAEHRLTLSPETYGYQSLEFLLTNSLVPKDMEARYSQVVRSLCEISERVFEGVPLQRIHGDLHSGNVLWDQDRCFFVDFDDMLVGPCIQDLWLLIPGRDEYAKERWEILLEGYEQMRPFDRSHMALVEPLRSLRIIYFSAWVGRRWEDPAFKKVFSSFGSLEYWREQLITLEEQLRLLQTGSLE